MPLPPATRWDTPGPARGFAPRVGSYRGYGIEPEHREADLANLSPILTLEKCIEAYTQVLSSVESTSDIVPWLFPPFRSKYRCLFFRAVLNVPLAVNAAANAAGLTLAAANSTIAAITVLTPVLAEPLLLFTVRPETRSEVVKLVSWGINVENAPDEALAVSLQGAAAGGLPAPPDPAISDPHVELHQGADAIIMEDKSIQVFVRNVTQTLASPTPLLITFGVCFYQYPVTRYQDSKNGAQLRTGFGIGGC